jgi:hypothetical protein
MPQLLWLRSRIGFLEHSGLECCFPNRGWTVGRGAAVGVLIWIGIVGPITYTTYMYEMRPATLFAINEFYPLAGLVLMGAILGAWTKKAA